MCEVWTKSIVGQHLLNCVVCLLMGLSKAAKEASEDVLAEIEHNCGELFGKNQALAEVSAVVLAHEKAVKKCNLLGHALQSVQRDDMLALVHVFHHDLHRGDHANPHLGLWVNSGQCAVVVLELGLITQENACLCTLHEIMLQELRDPCECACSKQSRNESRLYHL